MAKLNTLLAEKSALELKLFWKKHNITELRTAMEHANQNEVDGPNCSCLACAASGRKYEEKKTQKHGVCCAFKPYLEALLVEHGLTVDHVGSGVAVCAHEAESFGNMVYDNDTHFVHLARDDWVIFTYGAKLWRASSCQDPELQKLVGLFESLHSK
jgi:hypothetical protein